MYYESTHWESLAESTRVDRERILTHYRTTQGERPLHTITQDDLQRALEAKGGNPAVNALKALRPLFACLYKLKVIPKDPARGVSLDKPKSDGFVTASADDIERFQRLWPVGTLERLIFDLALLTGAARSDLTRLSRKNIDGNILTYKRQKTKVVATVPITPELRAVIERTPDIAPALILSAHGKPFKPESLGNKFGEAARKAGMVARIHGLRKACCVYWAEKGMSTHQIAAIAGHLSLSEVERYTRAADRRRMVELLVTDSK
jgi:integrase